MEPLPVIEHLESKGTYTVEAAEETHVLMNETHYIWPYVFWLIAIFVFCVGWFGVI